MDFPSFSFTHAITRKPGHSVIEGLRAVDTGAPDLEIFLKHHRDYVAALKSTGAEVIELAALDEFPDSVFVEDSALCLREGAIAMRPGADSRRGEAAIMAETLTDYYDEIHHIQGSGFVDGGDILTTESEILVGRSERTDRAGVSELKSIVERWGYRLREVQTPQGVLHFKTDCSLLDEETILSTPRLAATGCFKHYKVQHTAEGEEACANAIRFNELVIIPAGFPRTQETLLKAGYNVRAVGNSEAAKLDGGMSCLSLRFTPTG